MSGINGPDAALYESLKLLRSLLVTLVGNGLYGTSGSSSDMRFIDQGLFFSNYSKYYSDTDCYKYYKWILCKINCNFKFSHIEIDFNSDRSSGNKMKENKQYFWPISDLNGTTQKTPSSCFFVVVVFCFGRGTSL